MANPDATGYHLNTVSSWEMSNIRRLVSLLRASTVPESKPAAFLLSSEQTLPSHSASPLELGGTHVMLAFLTLS